MFKKLPCESLQRLASASQRYTSRCAASVVSQRITLAEESPNTGWLGAMDSRMMADTRWRLSQDSTAQLLELLWQVWDVLTRRLRFSEGPIRCRHKCEMCDHTCCFHSHSLHQEESHAWYGPHRCFLHDENGYDYPLIMRDWAKIRMCHCPCA